MLRGRQGELSLAAERTIYLFAAIVYIGLGFVRKEVFAWWSYGAIWFVACAWFVPPAVARLLGRGAHSDNSAAESLEDRETPAS